MSVARSECPLCRVEAHAGNPDGTPSARWIANWEAEREKYRRLNLPISRLKARITRHKASLILGREFGEDPEAFKERRGLTEYYKWKDYEQWDSHAHARGNPDGGPTAEELKMRIHHNLVRLLLIGGDCPLKYLIQLKEDLELWEKYEAAGLAPPVAEELVVQAP